jgi:hypothetical protein
MGLSNNFMTLSETAFHMFRNSGKDINDFGRYSDCVDKYNFNYYMATILEKFPVPMSLGLCVP